MKKCQYGAWGLLVCLLLIVGIALFFFLDYTQAFVYYYREQHQVFLNDADYIISLLKPIGGFTLLISQWLVQFFALPHMGAAISTLLCLISGVFFFLTFHRLVKNNWWILPLACIPSVLYCMSLSDVTVPYEGLVAIVLIAVCSWLFSLLWKRGWTMRGIGGTVLVLLCYYLAGPVTFAFPKKNNPAFQILLQQIHYADVEEWDKLLRVEGVNSANDVQMNYLNLALSRQGRLLEDLFAYPQRGIGSLISQDARYTDVGVLMSRINYEIGAIGAAQNEAFSSIVGITYGNPSMSKLLVKTYLINGYYALAEKQIYMLEKTTFYADWASAQRRFLYNDTEVEADPELGMKRHSLAPDDRYTMLYGPIADLVEILNNNPENRQAAEYLASTFLLAKDMDSVNAFLNQFGGKGCLTTLPKRLQEAMALIHQTDYDYCLAHGVSEETLQTFDNFKRTLATLRSQGKDIKALAPQYGKTFWYYYIR